MRSDSGGEDGGGQTVGVKMRADSGGEDEGRQWG